MMQQRRNYVQGNVMNSSKFAGGIMQGESME
jgi:hypothetical protein